MKGEARVNDIMKEIEDIKLQFDIKNWEAVQRMADDVISQLEKLAKQPGQSTKAKADISKMLKQVKFEIYLYVKLLDTRQS